MNFYNADGQLSAYGLACGYVEKQEKNNIQTTFYKEHDMFHVKTYDFNNHIRLAWESFESLTAARKNYKQQIKDYIK